jgi:transcription antitermination factor NusG
MGSLNSPSNAPPELYERPHWYACMTRSRAEKRVERMLADAGVEAFLPLLETERKWKDRSKKVPLPIFPGYVFARFNLGDVHGVLKIPGVATILRPNGYATPVREEEIESVRHMIRGVERTGVVPTDVDYMEVGEEVVVVAGPFKGMQGVLLEDRGQARVVVAIAALRQAKSVVVAREAVRRLKKAAG